MISISNDEFQMLASYIKTHTGINLKTEKKTLLVGRLTSRLAELKIDTFSGYYKHLINDASGVELSILVDKITTNHTFFMRESEHFYYLLNDVLPYLEDSVRDKDLRIWCAASSSGEEPYTLAMILNEYFKSRPFAWDKKLLATDVSVSILEQAKKGIYSAKEVETLPKMWVFNYFTKMGTNYQVKPRLKSDVIFRRFNLLERQFPFKKKFHVIFCRNVMIYFDSRTKEELINKMYDSLEYGGYLFIGHSETINRNKTKLKYIKPAVYRKI